MAKKKLKSNGIFFTGKAAEDVTGSQYLVKFGHSQCLLECGLHQSNDYLESYRANSAKYQFKPAEIDYLFLNHIHIDHSGGIGRLVHEGFRGKIITTSETAQLLKPMLLNSCAILKEEARILSKKYKRDYKPLYDEEDVFKALTLVETYDEYDTIFTLNDNVSFQWFRNSHCIGARQLLLILRDNIKIKKVLYTSDLGALHSKNHYVIDTEIPKLSVDCVIMESTYGVEKRQTKKKRSYDIKLLETAINTVLDRKGTAILPCFSFSRTQELLTTLYEIYGAQNVHFIEEKDESNNVIANNSPKIIISSSGFCTNGRIVRYLQKYLRNQNSMVIFSGYTGDNPSYLSYRIKNYRDNKFIKINGEQIPNRADCITLSTFSSHAGFNDLIKYGSSLKTNKLILVHGSAEAKKCLAEKLADEISKKNNTYRVIQSFKGMMVRL